MRSFLTGLAAAILFSITTGTVSAQAPVNYGCTSCQSGGGSSSFYDRMKSHTHKNSCNTGCGWLGGWDPFARLKAPCPSNAPTKRTDLPIGFPTHPYNRSPRDYFMVD